MNSQLERDFEQLFAGWSITKIMTAPSSPMLYERSDRAYEAIMANIAFSGCQERDFVLLALRMGQETKDGRLRAVLAVFPLVGEAIRLMVISDLSKF